MLMHDLSSAFDRQQIAMKMLWANSQAFKKSLDPRLRDGIGFDRWPSFRQGPELFARAEEKSLRAELNFADICA
jgi:hypothetical protein